MALVCLALLFLLSNLAFAQDQATDYLCEVGKSFYSLGRSEDALAEFEKVLLVDPGNKTAKEYISKILAADFAPGLKPRATEDFPKPIVAQDSSIVTKPVLVQNSSEPAVIQNSPVVQKLVTTQTVPLNNSVVEKSSLTKEQAMDLALTGKMVADPDVFVPYAASDNVAGKKSDKPGIKVGPLRVSGDAQVSFGVTPDEFIWKRANFDLNEKSKSWRMNSDAVFNNRFDTFDPRIYDRLNVNLDTENKEGFNFHSNLTIDPWSFTGKTSKITLNNGTDSAEMQLYYWSNTGYIVNNTVYTQKTGDTLNIPELKVKNGKTAQTIISSSWSGDFDIPSMKIERQFQPIRELWVDYANDQIKFRAFPMAYQDQVYTSDDPMNISNHGIWWKDSKWLRMYTPGSYLTGLNAYTKGYWDDSLSFLSKDSNGKYLTALRGFSFNFMPDESTSFDTTFATPKHLWQDYDQVDNVINATRLKHYFADNLMAGTTFTSRTGFITDPDQKLDSQNYVGGADVAYEVADGLKAQAEVLTSQSFYDMSNSTFKTESRGNAYYFSFISRYPQKSIMDLKYGYDEIALDKDESFLVKSKFYLSRMDESFDSSLSDYHNTRQDTFWSRHIHFRKPMNYYAQGLEGDDTNWSELNATRIGDGIDAGRNTIGFRVESFLDNKIYNLFDVRNVHNVNGKFIENVVRDEATVSITEKLTAKAFGIYQKLPHTVGGIDPFIYDGNTGEFFSNSAVPDGEDPSVMTGSLGLNYDFFDWLSLNGVYERTNDYYIGYDGFPANTLKNDTNLWGEFHQNDNLYKTKNPTLYDQGEFPQAPYDYFNVYKTGLRLSPLDNMDIYLDYTRNDFESAGQNSDNMNHVGIEITYMPCKKFGMAFKYTYSRWQDTDRLINGETNPLGHHNFFSEFRYLPSKDDEFIMQYGEGNPSNLGGMSLDPYGGTLLTIDTAHIIRAYYRRKF